MALRRMRATNERPGVPKNVHALATASALSGTGSAGALSGFYDDARDTFEAPVCYGRAKEFLATGFGQLRRRYLSEESPGAQQQALRAGDVERQRNDLPAELLVAHVERHPQMRVVRCRQAEQS